MKYILLLEMATWNRISAGQFWLFDWDEFLRRSGFEGWKTSNGNCCSSLRWNECILCNSINYVFNSLTN